MGAVGPRRPYRYAPCWFVAGVLLAGTTVATTNKDDIKVAHRKAQKATMTSDLSSNPESQGKGRGLRKQRRNPKYCNTSSEGENSEEDSENSNDFPRIPRNAIGPIYSSPVYTSNSQNSQKILMQSDEEGQSTNRITVDKTPRRSPRPIHFQKNGEEGRSTVEKTPRINSSSAVSTSRRSQSSPPESFDNNLNVLGTPKIRPLTKNTTKQCDCNAEFQRVVLEELNLLNLKIDGLCDNVSALNKAKKFETNATSLEMSRNIKSFNNLIPLNDEDKLINLENWINADENYKVVVSELCRIGGSSLAQTIRKILYRLFSNELALLYSWEGAKKKKAFKDLRIVHAILESVKLCHNDSTEHEIIMIIKGWLVKAKARCDRHQQNDLVMEGA